MHDHAPQWLYNENVRGTIQITKLTFDCLYIANVGPCTPQWIYICLFVCLNDCFTALQHRKVISAEQCCGCQQETIDTTMFIWCGQR